MKCIISCEHASNHVPPRYCHVFAGREKVLSTHRGYDPGAADLARSLAEQLRVPVRLGTISRLLVDLNRSPSNRRSLFTHYSRNLDSNDLELLMQEYYRPYREKVEGLVAGLINREVPVLHISVHSFVPELNGRVREADIGLLYDPARRIEKKISAFLVALLQEQAESLRVRRNYPYLGKTDGFTSFLRRKYGPGLYAGIEIELNQALPASDAKKYRQMTAILTAGIRQVLQPDYS